MNIEYTIQIWQEGDVYIAHAMPIDVMSSGATPEEARQALYEAVELFVDTATDMGTLENILQEAGYDQSGDNWTSPVWIAIERHSTTIST